ncbi:MAG: hypothetical protein FWG98_07065 [Candidatus Cloacimonetes bacterium]|nr:hypothetical protein [Candidatus Cloacimonadota bacterium]
MKIDLSEVMIENIPVFSKEAVKYFQENGEQTALISIAQKILSDVENESNEKEEIIDTFRGNRAWSKEDSLMRTQKFKLIYPLCKKEDLYDL